MPLYTNRFRLAPLAQLGRPRLKGKRLPTLKDLLGHPTTLWNTVTVDWYDNTHRLLEIASHSAVWYHQGKSPVPIRWVLIRDPLGEFRPQALLCTGLNVAPTQIIQWFVLRWQLEVTFQEVRAHLGVETQRQWSDRAIARTTPVLFGLFSWVTLAAAFAGGKPGISAALGRLVCQKVAHLLRRHRPGSSSAVACF